MSTATQPETGKSALRQPRADTMRVHRTIFPHTDHGYTWIECYWFEKDGRRVSPFIPAGGCTERLGHMPGGPMRPAFTVADEIKHYCADSNPRTINSTETVKDYCIVGSVSIERDRRLAN